MSKLDDNLLLHLKLDEVGDGCRLQDESSYQQNTVLKSGADFVVDQSFGKYIKSSQDNGRLVIGISGSSQSQYFTDVKSDTLSLSVWVYTGESKTDVQQSVEFTGYRKDISEQKSIWAKDTGYQFRWLSGQSGIDDGMHAQIRIVNPMPERLVGTGYQKTRVAPSRQSTSVDISVDSESWYHVTAFIGGNIPMIYVHDFSGALIAKPHSNASSGGGANHGANIPEVTYLQIAAYFPSGGGIANFRLHQCEISEEEAKQIVKQDLGGEFKAIPMLLRTQKQEVNVNMPTGQQSMESEPKVETPIVNPASVSNESPQMLHPVDFSLFDQHDQHILYMHGEPTQDDQLILELHNRSSRDIEFIQSANHQASADNHHLELRFRPGVLSKNTLAKLAEKNAAQQILGEHARDWDMQLVQSTTQGSVSLYLLKIGGRHYEDGLMLPLRYMSAEQGTGTRPTRVELKLGNMHYLSSDSLIVCRRSLSLQLMYGLPQQATKLPIHAGFPYSHTLLNDGKTENTLLLQITNITGQELQAPTLEIIFDIGDESQWWALCDIDELKKVQIKVKWPNEDWIVAQLPKNKTGENHGCRVIPSRNKVLPVGQHIEVKVSGIKTKRSGNTQLHVDFYNIPGYRPGRISCAIERSAVESNGGKVGIGIQEPKEKLDVDGTLKSLHVNTGDIHCSIMVETPVLQSGHVFTKEISSRNGSDITVSNGLQLKAGLNAKHVEAEVLSFKKGGQTGFSKVDGIDGADIPHEIHRLATTHYVKWLLGVKEHAVTFPDPSVIHDYFPSLTCYEFPNGWLRIIGKFYFSQDPNKYTQTCPLIKAVAGRVPLTQFPVGKGLWVLDDRGFIRPLNWKFDANDQTISVDITVKKLPT